jgi:hypothetical protein
MATGGAAREGEPSGDLAPLVRLALNVLRLGANRRLALQALGDALGCVHGAPPASRFSAAANMAWRRGDSRKESRSGSILA